MIWKIFIENIVKPYWKITLLILGGLLVLILIVKFTGALMTFINNRRIHKEKLRIEKAKEEMLNQKPVRNYENEIMSVIKKSPHLPIAALKIWIDKELEDTTNE